MNKYIKDKFALNHCAQIELSEDKEETADLVLTSAPEPAVVIAGQVTSNSQPFQGAVVKLFTDPDKNTPYQHETTNDKGYYSFVSIKPGTYYASAVAEGFILSPQVKITVTEGDNIVNLNITLDPSLLLGSISGKVTDENGPLHDSVVTLINKTTDEVAAVTTTIEDGEYAFYDLINNDYSVWFAKSRYYPQKADKPFRHTDSLVGNNAAYGRLLRISVCF